MAQISELALAAIVAGATCVGAIAGPLLSRSFLSADVENQSNVQLIEIAVNVLATPKPDKARAFSAEAKALRAWSVDTINAAAPTVKIQGAARESLINGTTLLPASLSLNGEKSRTVTQRGKPWEHNANKGGISLEDIDKMRRIVDEHDTNAPSQP